MPTDDPKLLEIKQKILNANQRREQAAWEDILSRESGRRVLWQLMEEFGLYSYCIPDNGNGSKMAEKAAKQGCAQYIRNRISFWVGGKVWALMEQESMQNQERDEAETERMTKEVEKQKQRKPQ